MNHPGIPEILAQSQLYYHLENTSFGMLLWDDQQKLVFCSKKAAELFECTPESLIANDFNLSDLVYAEDIDRVSSLIADLSSGRAIQNSMVNRNVTKKGKIIYCQWYNSVLKNELGKIINILSFFHDITTEIETRMALEKSQQKLSVALNSAIDPMWLIRVEGPDVYRFEEINVAFTKVTGWQPEQVIEKPMEKIIPPTSQDLVREKYKAALETEQIVDYIEESEHPSGNKYAQIRVIPIKGQNGEPWRILGIANDLTDQIYLRKKLEYEQEIKRRQITSAAIKGQEGERAKVSRELHDNVNQVLTTIKLSIELCMDGKVDQRETLRKCVQYLGETINDIRNLSKQLSAPSLGKTNLEETLNDLVNSFFQLTSIEVKIKFLATTFKEMDGELHLALYRVAQEQFTNIYKYAQATMVEVVIQEKSSHLHFSIRDNGKGFNLKEKRRGIGITNMQSRVETLNGHFEIRSSLGNGTEINISIPIIIEEKVCYAEQTILGFDNEII
ncbi:PAS domain S-box-containing protein [Cnuella takakiae]|uniref:Oxygen sensor histidine kinase NreB n=1 Tax=Cnuella takakiae TaxID=1302690 RepID=A0A1M4ZAS5_9BACT|nr:PAS domain S-box protein [Cnuella takakiae]SHF14676.1 PAS domain S-box-containing protein [Cnuella takakiae]